jgi:hypothetical protein
MARPSWSGFLRVNLISVPVKGYNACSLTRQGTHSSRRCVKQGRADNHRDHPPGAFPRQGLNRGERLRQVGSKSARASSAVAHADSTRES